MSADQKIETVFAFMGAAVPLMSALASLINHYVREAQAEGQDVAACAEGGRGAERGRHQHRQSRAACQNGKERCQECALRRSGFGWSAFCLVLRRQRWHFPWQEEAGRGRGAADQRAVGGTAQG